ncbi:MAG: Fic family protein [Pseudomonadota bacterium]
MAAKHLKKWIWQRNDWPTFTWDEAALSSPLAAARRAQGEITGFARLLDPSADLAAQLDVLTTEGVATSAIEGETFEPDAVRSSLARRLGLPAVDLPAAPRSVEGLAEVLLDATQRYREPLTLQQINSWQAALFPTGRSGLHEIRVGALRSVAPMRIISGPIGRELVHYEAPPGDRLGDEMVRFLTWFNAPPHGLDGLLRAGLAHAWFELIHPFEDGNGRVGRALMDRALAQDEGRSIRLYSLSARFMEVHDAYYAALEGASRGTLDVTNWLRWFLEQFLAASHASEKIVAHVVLKTRFWVKHSQSTLNTRQRKALNAMLDAGPQEFIGGMTNRKYAHLTKASPATAQRDLAALVELGCLVPTDAGRSARYELAI